MAEGDAIEAIFFVTAIFLRFTIGLVMIVLVSGSALLVVRSKKNRSLKHFRASKSNVLKLSAEQHLLADNFGQTCRNAKCQVVRSRRAPEILTKITVREARASYSQNERNQSNVETRL